MRETQRKLVNVAVDRGGPWDRDRSLTRCKQNVVHRRKSLITDMMKVNLYDFHRQINSRELTNSFNKLKVAVSEVCMAQLGANP